MIFLSLAESTKDGTSRKVEREITTTHHRKRNPDPKVQSINSLGEMHEGSTRHNQHRSGRGAETMAWEGGEVRRNGSV